MTFKEWITREFKLAYEPHMDDWQAEKSFGTTKVSEIVHLMKDCLHGYWQGDIGDIENPFLQSALETALNEIDWYELANEYVENIETY